MTAGEALTAKLARLQEQYQSLLSKVASSSSNGPHPTAPTAADPQLIRSTTRHSRASTGGSSETEYGSSSTLSTRASHSPTPSHGSSNGQPPVGPYPMLGSMPIHDPLIRAIRVQDMPPADRDKVIQIFFTGSQRLGCPLLPERVFARLRDPDPSRHPHPALVNAMLLVGQAFTSWTPGYSTAEKHHLPPTCPSADVLLAKTQAYLNEALSHVDRMLDYLQASILLSYYFFQTGRLQEGSMISSANSRLDQIDQSVLEEMLEGRAPGPGQSMWDGTLLGRPADTYELGVRIWTFWQSWYYDAVFSLIGGTPLTRDPVTPTTVFPRPSRCYETGIALELQNTSFRELYENNPPQIPSPAGEPEGSSHPLATYLKGLALMERANQLLGKVNAGLPLDDSEFSHDTLHKLHQSVQCLLTEHLPIRQQEMLSASPLSKQSAAKIYCPLAERVVGHVFIHTATIQLCRLSRALTANLPEESQRQAKRSIRVLELNAAKGAVRAVRLFGDEVRRLDARLRGYEPNVTTIVHEVQEHPCLLLGFLLTSVCMVLIDHIESLKLSPSASAESSAEIAATEADLRLLVATIDRTAESFGLLRIQSNKIKAYQDRSNREISSRQVPRWEFERRAGLNDDIF
ncbi:hypothetical protein FRC05_010727 [Tulasnella sp. 425]|nr:hypothetical protein FRC05_010727 [Tulasnella sp. 425]